MACCGGGRSTSGFDGDRMASTGHVGRSGGSHAPQSTFASRCLHAQTLCVTRSVSVVLPSPCSGFAFPPYPCFLCGLCSGDPSLAKPSTLTSMAHEDTPSVGACT